MVRRCIVILPVRTDGSAAPAGNYAAAEKFLSPNYIQHSAHIEPGRDGLFNLIRSAPDTLRYEHQVVVAEGDYVMVHGRFSGNGRPVA